MNILKLNKRALDRLIDDGVDWNYGKDAYSNNGFTNKREIKKAFVQKCNTEVGQEHLQDALREIMFAVIKEMPKSKVFKGK